MVLQPVHRHRWAESDAPKSSAVRVWLSLYEGGQPHDDPGSAEPALACTGVAERTGPGRSERGIHSVERCHRDGPVTLRAGVTQETRGLPSIHTVQHPHWPWGLHPSLALRRPRRSRSTSRSGAPSSATVTHVPVDGEGDLVLAPDGARGDCQLKEDPQPQVREAFGFEMWKPASFRPSL